MILRGTRTVLTLQVGADDLDRMSELSSAATNEYEVYVDIQQYLDLTEHHDTVEQALELYTDVDILCFFT